MAYGTDFFGPVRGVTQFTPFAGPSTGAFTGINAKTGTRLTNRIINNVTTGVVNSAMSSPVNKSYFNQGKKDMRYAFNNDAVVAGPSYTPPTNSDVAKNAVRYGNYSTKQGMRNPSFDSSESIKSVISYDKGANAEIKRQMTPNSKKGK